MAGPLQGIVVLDLTRVLAGPWATQALADYGAEVIKIEKPGAGDDTRHWGPPWLKDRAGRDTAESAYYLSTNRGKKSVAIDLAHADGQDLVRQLARGADVVVENFKVGGLAKYGLAYADIEAINPRAIYLSISAFGQDGPDAAGPGYDAAIQGMGGLMSLTGVPDGEPGAGPQKVGVAVADLMCGMYAVSSVLAALFERQQSGRGQFIDLALLDTQVAWLANQNMNYLIGGVAPQRQGTAHPNIVPYQAFATADGYLMLSVGNDGQFTTILRRGRSDGARGGPAVCHQSGARREPCRAGAACAAGAAGAGRRRTGSHGCAPPTYPRPDQRSRPGLRRTAGASSRHAHRPASSGGRDGPRRTQPGAFFTHAARVPAGGAVARGRHRIGAARKTGAGASPARRIAQKRRDRLIHPVHEGPCRAIIDAAH